MAAKLSGSRIAIPTATSNPSSPTQGDMYYNSDDGTIKFYDGSTWIATNLVPVVNSVSGTIYSGVQTTVTLSVAKTTDQVDIQWREGSTLLATSSGVTVSSGSISISTPSQVYGQSNGDTITASLVNSDGTASSNTGQWTVQGLPTGGTINTYTSGSTTYRSHTFTSSGTLSVPTTRNMDFMIIAGGSSGGVDCGGGGGAGGCILGSIPVGNGNHTVTIGGGGAPRPGPSNDGPGNLGGNSAVFGYTATRGGAGTGWTSSGGNVPGGSGAGQGGSGSGANPAGVGSGISGQGNPGGSWTNPGRAGGGGGKGGSGSPGGSNGTGGAGIDNNYRTGSNIRYAAGGTGGIDHAGGVRNSSLGTAAGLPTKRTDQTGESNSPANSGHGGHGANHDNQNSGGGGSGICVIRYSI